MSSTIIFPIETSSRELLYKVYLSHELAVRGYKCYIGEKNAVNKLIQRSSRYIYFDKGYHKDLSEKYYEVIKKREGIIVSLDEEGAVDYDDNSTLLTRYPREMINNVDHIFLWGNRQLNLIKNLTTDLKKFTVSGHPRFHLLKKEFHYLYEDQSKDILLKYGDFILINTNMGFGNNIKGEDFVLSNYANRIKKLDQIIEFDKQKLNSIINMVKDLSLRTEMKIIIRPHPEEDASIYRKNLKGCKNVEVLYEGSVIPWLLACKRLIHTDCTTAIEYYLLGGTPLSLLPAGFQRALVTELPLLVSESFSKSDEIIDRLFAFDSDSSLLTINPVVEDSFATSLNSIQTICEKISSEFKLNSTFNDTDRFSFKEISQACFRRFINRFFRGNKALQLKENKLNGFSLKATRGIVNKMNSKMDTSVNVKEVYPGLFSIGL